MNYGGTGACKHSAILLIYETQSYIKIIVNKNKVYGMIHIFYKICSIYTIKDCTSMC